MWKNENRAIFFREGVQKKVSKSMVFYHTGGVHVESFQDPQNMFCTLPGVPLSNIQLLEQL